MLSTEFSLSVSRSIPHRPLVFDRFAVIIFVALSEEWCRSGQLGSVQAAFQLFQLNCTFPTHFILKFLASLVLFLLTLFVAAAGVHFAPALWLSSELFARIAG